MKHHVSPSQCLDEAGTDAKVSFDYPGRTGSCSPIACPGTEVVEYGDVIASRNQCPDQVVPDEARAASDQDPHRLVDSGAYCSFLR